MIKKRLNVDMTIFELVRLRNDSKKLLDHMIDHGSVMSDSAFICLTKKNIDFTISY